MELLNADEHDKFQFKRGFLRYILAGNTRLKNRLQELERGNGKKKECKFQLKRHEDYSYLRYERNPDPCIRFNEFQQHLSPYILQQVLYIISNEWIIHDGSSITLHKTHFSIGYFILDYVLNRLKGTSNPHLEDFLKFQYLISLICSNQVCHGQDFWVIFVPGARSY